MSEHSNEALCRQIGGHPIRLILVGVGYCPGCREQKEIFSRRLTLEPTKERCLN